MTKVKKLTVEEIQLWWEINDSDIVTIPEEQQCETTMSQQQPLFATTNEENARNLRTNIQHSEIPDNIIRISN